MLLTPDEVIKAINDWNVREDKKLSAADFIAKAQARKDIEWLEEECDDETHYQYYDTRKRRHCEQCWQAFKEEVYGDR